MDLGLRLASCLCEAGGAAEKLRRHGIFKMSGLDEVFEVLCEVTMLGRDPRALTSAVFRSVLQSVTSFLSLWKAQTATHPAGRGDSSRQVV